MVQTELGREKQRDKEEREYPLENSKGNASQPGFDNSSPSQLVPRFDTTIFRIYRLCIMPHRRSRCKRDLLMIKGSRSKDMRGKINLNM